MISPYYMAADACGLVGKTLPTPEAQALTDYVMREIPVAYFLSLLEHSAMQGAMICFANYIEHFRAAGMTP